MTHIRLLAASAALFVASICTASAADRLGSERYPKHFHWQEEVKGETVVMDIDAAYFVAANHKVRRGGGLIDGYPAEPGYRESWGSKFPHFTINAWKIRWGRKRLHLFPRGAYTSLFTPALRAYENPDATNVDVVVCDSEDALMVNMHFGYDGVTGTVSFVVTRDGRIRRFITRVYSSNTTIEAPHFALQRTAAGLEVLRQTELWRLYVCCSADGRSGRRAGTGVG